MPWLSHFVAIDRSPYNIHSSTKHRVTLAYMCGIIWNKRTGLRHSIVHTVPRAARLHNLRLFKRKWIFKCFTLYVEIDRIIIAMAKFIHVCVIYYGIVHREIDSITHWIGLSGNSIELMNDIYRTDTLFNQLNNDIHLNSNGQSAHSSC